MRPVTVALTTVAFVWTLRGGPSGTLDRSKAALAQRMHASGESDSNIAATLSVGRATVYHVLVDQGD